MKKLLVLTLGAALLVSGLGASAADGLVENSAESIKKTAGMPFRGKVSAFDKEALTLALAGKAGPRLFQLSAETKIRRNGEPATVDDVVVGELVGGYALRNSEGLPTVVTLTLGSKVKSRKPDNEGKEAD